MKCVLVTGAHGFVGARVMQGLAGQLQLAALPAGMAASAGEEQLYAFVGRLQPQAILHMAALSDTGYCEAHPEQSYRANVQLPVWLAKAARAHGAKLVAFSSDQVYTGLAGPGPFAESQPLRPANVYGRHKWEAEQRVLALAPTAVLLRASWMYDLPGRGLPVRGNLPLNLVQAALAGQSLPFSPNDRRGVSYVWQAVQALPAALNAAGGVYNFGSENALDMYATALDFCAVLGLAPPPVRQASFARSLAMDTAKARRAGMLFSDTAGGIRQCLAEYGLRR